MRVILEAAGLALAVSLLLPTSAVSASVTFQFQGTVTEVYDDGVQYGTPWLDGSVQVGTPFSGAYTFDPDTPDANPEPSRGRYPQTTPPAEFYVGVGSYRFFSVPSNPQISVLVGNDDPLDRYFVRRDAKRDRVARRRLAGVRGLELFGSGVRGQSDLRGRGVSIVRAVRVGDVQPGAACAAYLARVAEVAGAAAPCWEQISEELPAEQWLAARRWCEDQAHLAVCARVPCY